MVLAKEWKYMEAGVPAGRREGGTMALVQY